MSDECGLLTFLGVLFGTICACLMCDCCTCCED